MCIDFFLFAVIIAELFLGFLGVFLTDMTMDETLWLVLLKLVHNKTATPPQEWGGTGEAIFAIEQMVGFDTSKTQGYFNALDPKTKEAIWYILELAHHERDNLLFRLPPESKFLLLLDVRHPQERLNTGKIIQQKIELLQPLLDIFEAIQPTSFGECFFKTTAGLMAGLPMQNRENLGLALSDYVRSMTRR
jgi:hypothetical protein